MDRQKMIADFGRLDECMGLGVDLLNPVQLRFTAALDHEIDGVMLAEAWERTKRVYPVLDAVLGFDRGDANFYLIPGNFEKYRGDHLYLAQPEGGENRPLKSKIPVRPATPAFGGRLASVSYYGNTVSFSSYHTLLDGGGMKMVFSTFLYTYFALYTGQEDPEPVVELAEGRDLDAYYVSRYRDYVASLEYKPTPLYTLPRGCRGIPEPEAVNDEHVHWGAISLPAAGFMRFCKENGANPSAMLCVMMARATYLVHPEEQGESVFHLTLSNRKALGLEKYISNAIGLATVYLTREEAENRPLPESVRKIRQDMESQRTKDYQVSFARLFETYQHAPAYVPGTVTYVGPLDIGSSNCHITDFRMETGADRTAYLAQLNDRFLLMLQYGKATEKYIRALGRVLEDAGVSAEITSPVEYVAVDSPAPIL